MTQSHTPGPWTIGPHPGNGAGTAWRQILSHSGPFSPAFVCEAIEPDARLIAAAPDMARALRDLLALHIAHHNHPRHARAREILRAIEGA